MGKLLNDAYQLTPTQSNQSYLNSVGASLGISPATTGGSTSTGFSTTTSTSTPGAVGTGVFTPTPLGTAANAVPGNAQQLELPSWLPTNPNGLVKELHQQYKRGPRQIIKAGRKAANVATSAANFSYQSDSRNAGNAAAEYSNRLLQAGINPVGGGAVKAQLQSGANAKVADAKVAAAKIEADAKQNAASLSSQIATNLSSIRSGYLGTLANANATLRSQNLGNNASNASLGIQQQGVNNQLAEYNRQFALEQQKYNDQKSAIAAAGAGTGGSGGGGTGGRLLLGGPSFVGNDSTVGMGTYLGPRQTANSGDAFHQLFGG